MRTRRSVLGNSSKSSQKSSNALDAFNSRGILETTSSEQCNRNTPVAVAHANLEPCTTQQKRRRTSENIRKSVSKKGTERIQRDRPRRTATKRRKSLLITLNREKLEETSISMLGDEELLTIFHLVKLNGAAEEDPCMTVLPLVCKRWYEILKRPSHIWKSVSIGSTARDISIEKATKWLKPRSSAVLNMQLNISSFTSRNSSSDTKSFVQCIPKTLKYLSLSVANWKDISQLSSCSSVTALRILADEVPNQNLCKELEHFESIEMLEISFANKIAEGSQIVHFNEEFVKKYWRNLIALTITGPSYHHDTNACRLEIDGLQYLERLQSINISNCSLDPRNFMHFHDKSTKFGNLRRASFLHCNFFGDTIQKFFRNLGCLPNLETLKVQHSNLTRIDYGDIDGNTSLFPRLTSLDLSFNNLGPFLEVHDAFKAHKKLRHFALNCCNISALPKELGNFLPCLENLDVANNRLVDLPEEIFSLPNLKILNASGNSFPALPRCVLYPTGIRNLIMIDLSHCTCLEISTPIRNAFLENFPFLRHFSIFKGIDIPFQKSTERCISELQKQFAAMPTVDGKKRHLTWSKETYLNAIQIQRI